MTNFQMVLLSIALVTSAPALAEPIVEVTIPALTGDAVIGEKVFSRKCADCHGEAGAGNSEKGPPLIHKIYEPSHHGDMAFLVAALNGVQQHHWDFGNMMPIEGITQAEVAMIVEYIRQIQRANGIN